LGPPDDQFGSEKYLGRFDIEAELTRMSKGKSWVSAKSGARPKYGDIFRPKKFHMGISLDFEGDKWNTAESGLGVPKTGFDIIKRKQADALQGWVDLELYFDSASQIGPNARLAGRLVGTGIVGVEPFSVITIRRTTSGTVKKFVKAPVVIEQMGGTWNGKEPLTAVKM
jgi:hypothetical protein